MTPPSLPKMLRRMAADLDRGESPARLAAELRAVADMLGPKVTKPSSTWLDKDNAPDMDAGERLASNVSTAIAGWMAQGGPA